MVPISWPMRSESKSRRFSLKRNPFSVPRPRIREKILVSSTPAGGGPRASTPPRRRYIPHTGSETVCARWCLGMVGGFRHKEAHAQPQVTANERIRVSFERGPTAITVSFAMNSQWASSKTPCRRAGLAVTRLRVRVLAPCAALPLVALTWRTPPHARPCSLPPSRPLWLRPASRRLVRRGIDLLGSEASVAQGTPRSRLEAEGRRFARGERARGGLTEHS